MSNSNVLYEVQKGGNVAMVFANYDFAATGNHLPVSYTVMVLDGENREYKSLKDAQYYAKLAVGY